MLSLCFFETNQILTPPAGMGKATSILRKQRFTGLGPGAFLLEEVVSCSDDSLGSQMSV